MTWDPEGDQTALGRYLPRIRVRPRLVSILRPPGGVCLRVIQDQGADGRERSTSRLDVNMSQGDAFHDALRSCKCTTSRCKAARLGIVGGSRSSTSIIVTVTWSTTGKHMTPVQPSFSIERGDKLRDSLFVRSLSPAASTRLPTAKRWADRDRRIRQKDSKHAHYIWKFIAEKIRAICTSRDHGG